MQRRKIAWWQQDWFGVMAASAAAAAAACGARVVWGGGGEELCNLISFADERMMRALCIIFSNATTLPLVFTQPLQEFEFSYI